MAMIAKTEQLDRVVKTTDAGDRCTFVGIAHLSPTDSASAANEILKLRPQNVVLEIDAKRVKALDLLRSRQLRQQQAVLASADHVTVYSNTIAYPGTKALLFAYLSSSYHGAVSSLYESSAYGAEVDACIDAANRVGATVYYGDRDLMLTLARAEAELSWSDILSLLPTAMCGIMVTPKYNLPIATALELVWKGLTAQSAFGLTGVLRKIVLESAAADPVFASSLSGRQLHIWNAKLIEAFDNGRISRSGKVELGAALHNAP
jgi:pheromone shutdown protein TraB